MKKHCAGKSAVLCSLFIVLSIALASCSEEEIEVSTVGRLTITGLDAYNGKKIFAVNNRRYGTSFRLVAYGYVTSAENYYPAQISSGQATLKVYKEESDGNWINYNGNDKSELFAVVIVGTIYGRVFVDFTNGIASGVFVPDK